MMPSTLARIRWRILAFMFGFAFLSYLQRSSLSVAAGHIMPDLHLSKGQIGMLMWAFTVVYTLAQLPGGIIGQRYGARRVYFVVGLVGSVATVATPIAPMLLGGLGLFVVLLAAQSALGASQGPVFPAFAGVVANWFPKHQWSLAQGLQTAGMNIGAAVAPPLIVALERGFDWQGAMISVGLPGLLLAIAWLWYGRNRPDQHPAVSAAELAELGESRALHIQPLTVARLKAVLADRNVLLLTLSYLCMNYLFYLLQNYSFLYLTEERHFAGMQAGWLGMLPPVGAGIGSALGGVLGDRFAQRYGFRRGYRIVPLVTLPAAGVLLLLANYTAGPYTAVAALTLAYFSIEATEAPYWAATMCVAREDSMAAAGVLNTGGNLGGVVGIPIITWFWADGHWTAAFVTGTAFAVAAAAAWLMIDPERRIGGARS
jgi:ACS family glucarate transporter-like MFS transporter